MITEDQVKALVKGIQTLEKRVHELEVERDNLKHANKNIVKAIVKNLEFFNHSGEPIPEINTEPKV